MATTVSDPALPLVTAQPPSVMSAMLYPSMAAALGWGIRGQYGHETGAMIAGCLASLTLVLLFAPHFSLLAGVRAAALMTAAIGIGGSMSYGQTVGLTHDAPLIGHWEALRWGMLGLAIKGGLWIGFGGVFLGMGLSGKRYRVGEMAAVMLGLLLLYRLGTQLLNTPFDPANKVLPTIYFSDSWYFEPDSELKPRREVWGGMLVSLVGLLVYVRFVKQDHLAFRLGTWGILAGGLGFPGGQSIQAYHAWNPQVFTASPWNNVFQYFNWWNMMETGFGAIWGAVLGLGVWWNRRWIPTESPPDEVSLSSAWEVALCVLHLIVLLSSDFGKFIPDDQWVSYYTQWGLLMTVLPIIAIFGGRFWPFLMVLPIVAAPICSKSIKSFGYDSPRYSPDTVWLLAVALPLVVLFYAATIGIERSYRKQSVQRFVAVSLLLMTWTFFGLNTVFFDNPWPWRTWTGRTPNHLIYMVCALGLTVRAIFSLRKRQFNG